MAKIFTRMGDGWAAELSEAELMKDIEDGSRDADEIWRCGPGALNSATAIY